MYTLIIIAFIFIIILLHSYQKKKPYCTLCHSRHNGKCIIELRGGPEDNNEFRNVAHEIWATSQLVENEGIEDGVDRVENYLKMFARNFLHKKI